MLLKPFGFNRKEAAPSGGGITITHEASPAYNESNLSTYTWSGIGVGNLALVHTRATSNPNITAVTIDGNAAVEFSTPIGASLQKTVFWYASGATSGGTGNTVVTVDITAARAFLRQMHVTGADMSAPFAEYSDVDNDNINGSVTVTTVPVGGAIIAMTRSFSDITGLANKNISGDDPKVAWEVFPSGATNVVVTGVDGAQFDQDLSVIVLEPA